MKTRTLIIDGEKIVGEYIGQGLFCKAYRHGEKVYLLCKGDYSKECAALFCDLDLEHMPQIEKHADMEDSQVFSMPYYRPLVKKNFPSAFALWRKLPPTLLGYKAVQNFAENCDNPTSLREAVRNLADAFCNYVDPSDMLLEFNKANVSVNHAGGLVLRDCLASVSSIKKRREKRPCYMNH